VKIKRILNDVYKKLSVKINIKIANKLFAHFSDTFTAEFSRINNDFNNKFTTEITKINTHNANYISEV
jgi:hypothetical protein